MSLFFVSAHLPLLIWDYSTLVINNDISTLPEEGLIWDFWMTAHLSSSNHG